MQKTLVQFEHRKIASVKLLLLLLLFFCCCFLSNRLLVAVDHFVLLTNILRRKV